MDQEYKRYFVHLDIGDTDDHILELIVLPSIGRTFDHGESSIVLVAQSLSESTRKAEQSLTNSSYFM